MRSITFTIPGPPRGKGRPRFYRKGAGVGTYTDDKTAAYENLVTLAYKAAGGEMMKPPMVVMISMFHPIPKSASKKMREAMEVNLVRPTKKPDADNCGKAVLDGLNGVAFEDDAQVVTLYITKKYSAEPRVYVEVTEI
jgi:Holliday junction resolvase RusA-like endonuclease